MLLEVDHMPWFYNVITSIAHWVLLIGYLIVPGMFTSLQRSDKIKQALADNSTRKAILGTIPKPTPFGYYLCALHSRHCIAYLAFLGIVRKLYIAGQPYIHIQKSIP
jgi:hypothetical protein